MDEEADRRRFFTGIDGSGPFWALFMVGLALLSPPTALAQDAGVGSHAEIVEAEISFRPIDGGTLTVVVENVGRESGKIDVVPMVTNNAGAVLQSYKKTAALEPGEREVLEFRILLWEGEFEELPVRIQATGEDGQKTTANVKEYIEGAETPVPKEGKREALPLLPGFGALYAAAALLAISYISRRSR